MQAGFQYFKSFSSQYILAQRIFSLCARLSQYLLFLPLLISCFPVVTFVEVIIDVWPIREEPYVI